MRYLRIHLRGGIGKGSIIRRTLPYLLFYFISFFFIACQPICLIFTQLPLAHVSPNPWSVSDVVISIGLKLILSDGSYEKSRCLWKGNEPSWTKRPTALSPLRQTKQRWSSSDCETILKRRILVLCITWRVSSQNGLTPFWSIWDNWDLSCWNISKIIRKFVILLIITSKIFLYI